MNLHLFIDESGSFDEALKFEGARCRQSVVGAVCSDSDDVEWEKRIRLATDDFNKRYGTRFRYPDHIHCAPLFAGHGLNGIERIKGPLFAETIQSMIAEKAPLMFASINPLNRFEFSPQATYGVNLLALVRSVGHHLAEVGKDVTGLSIVVAQRSIQETNNGDPRYTDYLLKYLVRQYSAGTGPGPELMRRLKSAGHLIIEAGIATKKAGLMAADFVSSNVREGRIKANDANVIYTEPDEVVFGLYRERYDSELKHLVENRQYAAALTFQRLCMPQGINVSSIAPIMTALKNEEEPAVLASELQAMLLATRSLIDQRQCIHDGLSMARDILIAIITASEKKLSAEVIASQKRAWVDALAQALAELVVCFNHIGDKTRQSDIELRLNQVLKDHSSILPRSRAERSELLLEVKVRNLNILFNDYRFQDVVDAIQPDADARAKAIPEDETDELLGKMYGSLGQAYALMARTEPEWSELAREYFEKSIRNFAPGTLFHSMTVNYLCTLAWQENNLELAIRETQRSPNWPRIPSVEQLFVQYDALISDPRLSSFDLVNLLRMWSLGLELGKGVISRNQIERCVNTWAGKLTPEHPAEQVYKWLAYLHVTNGNIGAAVALCDRGLVICEQLGFTVKTIGLSILGLKTLVWNMANNAAESEKAAKGYSDLAATLVERSRDFGKYCDEVGATCWLGDLSEKYDPMAVRSALRLLPFYYS